MRTSHHRIAPVRCAFASLVLSLAFCCSNFTCDFKNCCKAQEAAQERGDLPDSETQEAPFEIAIQRLIDDYDSFMNKRAALEGTYRRIGLVLEETEKDFSLLQAENLQQQLNAAVTAYATMEFNRTTPRPTLVQSRDRNIRRQQDIANNNYFATQNMLNADALMRSEQVRQLSTAQQATIRKRAEAIQDFQQLQADLGEWNAKYFTFFPLYWRYADTEGIRTESENESILAKLRFAPANNVPAKIIKGLIELRLDRNDDALDSLTEAIDQNSGFTSIAYASRAMVHLNRDENKKATKDMQQASKLDPKDRFVVWFKAEFAARRGDFGTAKKTLLSLSAEQDLEIAARRRLAFLCTTGKDRSDRDIAKGLEQAQLVSDLTGSEDWYSELVLAIALYGTKDIKEALNMVEHAKLLAKEENADRCDSILSKMEANEPIDWDFLW